jgi:[ribosomal protein S5]-alanine N-acetyltransferase
MKTEMPTLQLKRLILRPFRKNDAAAIQRLAGDRAIADTTLNIPHPYEDGMAEAWIETHEPKFAAGELANFAVALQINHELIGAIGLVINRLFDQAELGYWIGRPFWGQGYCTEAGCAILQYGFGDLNINRIYASHFSRNPSSGRVMQKLGMTKEGVLRQHVKKWDKYEDLVMYGLLKREWEKDCEHHVYD